MKILYYASPFQSVFKLSTNCDMLANMITLKYGKYIYPSCPDKTVSHTISAVKHEDKYIIDADDHFSISTMDPLLYIDKYFFENKTYDEKVWAMHGAAVEYMNRAYLFIAPTTSGKTTLTAYLTSLGFGYIAEDCVLIDRTTYDVYPCTSPLKLREGGVNVLKKEGILQNNLKKLEIGSVS